MSTVDFLGNAKDHSAGSSDLARIGGPTFGYDGDAFVQCGVGTDYLAGSTSAQTITGTEVWIAPAIRGLTVGCWVRVDASPTTTGGLVTKWGIGGTRSYLLAWQTDNKALFGVTATGGAATSIASGINMLDEWIFIVGRFTPSNEVAVFVDSAKFVNTTAVPASIFTGTSVFEVARLGALTSGILQASFRDAFLCAVALTDIQIENLRLSSLPTP
ncbi:MAG: hypothetical protein KAS66_12765 [Candidatus Omnitrophica bacterium]|nr:hypothetical protein [Candidatus Omnitrophota bacterium]